MLKACVVCSRPSTQARCPTHRYERKRGAKARAQRMRVIERDGFRCCMCGTFLTGARDTHVDHVIPLAQGGATTDENLRTTCSTCNLRKGAT